MVKNNLCDIDLFFIRLKHNWVSKEKKKKLYELVIGLENATNLQKERFISVYDLQCVFNRKYNLSHIAKKQNCSSSAVRYSVSRIRNFLVNLQDERKTIFLQIIKDDDYFKKN